MIARKRIMLVCRGKKGKHRKIAALTPKLTSDPNFLSVSFISNCIYSFLDVSSLFLFRMGFKISDMGKDHF